LSSIRAKFLEKTKGKGTLDLTAFCALAGMGQKMGKKVFDLFDMDGDGLIDDYEFICGLALFTKTNVKQRMEAIFRDIRC
jgi:Ca2+-binding EF-hand superfamily protein